MQPQSVQRRVFAARPIVHAEAAPVWPDLVRDALSWRRGDSGAGTPLEAYERYRDAFSDGPEDLARAVAFFLSRGDTPPDRVQWRILRAATSGPDPAHPYDVAMAWGAGWRGGSPSHARTGRIGDAAILALVEQVQAALGVTVRLLQAQLGLDLVEPDEQRSLAAAIAMSLLGACDCGHHVRGCGSRCGRGCCFADHDLRLWDPATCHLRPFVDQAVRGTAQRRILGGAFAESMLFRLLEAEGRLLCRTVEWGRCEICDRAFEGSRCPDGHRVAAAQPRREPRKNQIIVPARATGTGHVPIQRWWCGVCHHLHGSATRRHHGITCPRCGAAEQSSKAVWTLAAAARQPQAV